MFIRVTSLVEPATTVSRFNLTVFGRSPDVVVPNQMAVPVAGAMFHPEVLSVELNI